MPIVNRDLDASQQTNMLTTSLTNLINGQTYVVFEAPYPCQLISAQNVSIGVSGAPNHSLWLNRFVVGSGVTSVVIGNSIVVTTFGTSGAQGFSLPNAATTTLLFQAGDILTLSTAGGAGTASINTAVTFVVKALQDIKSAFGV